MASLGESHPSTRPRDSDLPDPAAEKRELRRMVQGLHHTIRKAKTDLEHVRDQHLEGKAAQHVTGTINDLQRALDGGGEAS